LIGVAQSERKSTPRFAEEHTLFIGTIVFLIKCERSSICSLCRNTCYNVELSDYPQLEIILTLDFAENMLV